jgi:hypothetical protein
LEWLVENGVHRPDETKTFVYRTKIKNWFLRHHLRKYRYDDSFNLVLFCPDCHKKQQKKGA